MTELLIICALCKRDGGTMQYVGKTVSGGHKIYVHHPKSEAKENRECQSMLKERSQQAASSPDAG